MVLYVALIGLSCLTFSPTFADWWASLVNRHSNYNLAANGAYAIVVVTYLGMGSLFLLLDLRHRPSALYRYKIQAGRPLKRSVLPSLFANIAFNFGIVMLAIAHGFVGAMTARDRGVIVSAALPPAWKTAGTIGLFGVLHEPVFYYSHRLLHWGPLFRHVHKVHHAFHAPIALAAVYAHPLEFALQNIMPLIAPYVLFRTHLFTLFVGCVVNVLGTLVQHCGYRFPWYLGGNPASAKNPNFHDFHHESTDNCFGISGMCDRLHGTDRKWKEAITRRGGHAYFGHGGKEN